MPGGAAVDVIMAVAFLLFVLSIVSAAVTELIASAFNWRGKMLREGLGRLLGAERAVAAGIPSFGDLMDRMTGWYKRRVQWTVLLVAFAGCVALNADSFALGNRFVGDEAVKQVAVARAQDGPGTAAAAAAEVAGLPQLALPFGWGAANRPDDAMGWLGKLAGWIVTAISIPLGAAFWFDVLSKFSRQRAAGVREGASTRDDPDETGRP